MNPAIRKRIAKRVVQLVQRKLELELSRDSFEHYLDPYSEPPAAWQALADSEGQPLRAVITKYIAISERLQQDKIDEVNKELGKLQVWLRGDAEGVVVE